MFNKKFLFFVFFLFVFSFAFHYFLFLESYSIVFSGKHFNDLNNNFVYYFITGKDAHYYSSGLMSLINSNYHTPFTNLSNDWFVYTAFLFHKFTNLNFTDTVKFFPVFMGSLISPLFYMLSKKLLLLDFRGFFKDGNKFNLKFEIILVFISVIVGIYPIIIYRTFAGWLDTDIIILPGLLLHFLVLTNLYFKISCVNNELHEKNIFVNLIFLFAIDVFSIKAYFNNSIIIIISLSLFLIYILFQLYKDKHKNNKINKIYKKISLIILGFLFYFFHITSSSILIEIFTFFIIVLSFLISNLKTRTFIIIFILLFLFVFLYQNPWVFFVYSKINSYIFTKVKNVQNSASIVFSNASIDISELNPVKFYDFVFLIFVIPFFGLITYLSFVCFFLKKRLSFYILLPLFLVGSTIFISGNRFLIYLVFPLFYSFVYLYFLINIKHVFNTNYDAKNDNVFLKEKILKIIDVVFLFSLTIMFIFFFIANIKIAKERGEKLLKTKQELQIILDKYYSQKKRNLKNKKSKYVFIWWEYGYPVSFYTQVITAPNNGNQNPILKYLIALTHDTDNIQQKKCYGNVLYLYINYISSNKINSKKANHFLIKLLKQSKNKIKPSWCSKDYPYIFIDYVNGKYEKNMKKYLSAFRIKSNK